MRVIAGNMKGRLLHVPRHASFRPTTDRVKEAVFNILNGMVTWEECAVCDLFAGSGSLGIEALSRGARSATFVEQSRESRMVLERNITALGLRAQTRIEQNAVERYCAAAAESCDLLFADPPYDYDAYEDLIACAAGLLRPDGLAVLEHAARVRLPESGVLHLIDRRAYGATAVTLYRSLTGEAS